MEALSRPPELPRRPVPLIVGNSIEWRSPTTGEVVGLTGVAPHGRKGLWAAMAAASIPDAERREDAMSMGEITDDESIDDQVTIDVDALEANGTDVAVSLGTDEAHMAYLAKIAFSEAGDRIRARTPETRTVAQVVDLDVFRARYGRRRH